MFDLVFDSNTRKAQEFLPGPSLPYWTNQTSVSVLHRFSNIEVRFHDLGDLREVVLLDQLHVERALHGADLELSREILHPSEHVLGALLNVGRLLGLLLLVLDGTTAALSNHVHSRNGADELLVDGHVVHGWVLPLLPQLVHERLDMPIIVQPCPELHSGGSSDTTRDEHALEVYRVDLGVRQVQLIGSLRPRPGGGAAVSRWVTLSARHAEVLLVLAEEPDDQGIDVELLRPIPPSLEGVRQGVDLAPVRERHRDGLAERTLVRQVARGDDRLDVHLRAVDAVELEQLKKWRLNFGFHFIYLIYDQHELLRIDLRIVLREEVRHGIVHALVGRDDRQTDEVRRFENAHVKIDVRICRTRTCLLSHLRLAGSGHAEHEQILAVCDVEVQHLLVGALVDAMNVGQHDFSSPVDRLSVPPPQPDTTRSARSTTCFILPS